MDTGIKIKKAGCFFCHNNCGVLVHVKNNRVIKVTGNPDHPMSKGYICQRAVHAPKWLYHPDQLQYPLKRAGKRGEGKWQRISWNHALDEISGKLDQHRQAHGAESLVVTEGTYRSDHFWARTRFLNLFGNPQNLACPGVICGLNCYNMDLALVGSMNYGSDLVDTQCVVIWGGNPKETRLTRWLMLRQKMRQGDIKVIVVDSRVTGTAAHADICLQLRPGTDNALALGWIHIIINEGLYDREFVENWTHGFEKVRERVAAYTPQHVAKITGLAAEDIVKSARMYATTKPACMERGVASDQLGLNSARVEQARVILRAITGNIDVRGGNPVSGPSYTMDGKRFVCDSELELSDKCPVEQRKKQIGSDRYKLMTWPAWEILEPYYKKLYNAPNPQQHRLEVSTPLVLRAIINEKPYPIKAMISWASNPVLWAGNTKLVLEALTHPNLDIHVVRDYWMTPTAQLADYVLPAASWLERPLCGTFEDMFDNVFGGERAIDPMGERKTDFQFWRDLGIRLGQEAYWPWNSLEEVIQERLEPLEMSYEEFIEKGCLLAEKKYRKYEKTGFSTPTGKVELYSTVLEKLGYDPLPYYEEPPESPVSTPELLEQYPLILTTGSKFMPMFHSEHRQKGIGLREKHPDPLVHIHPKTAEDLGINHGDWVYIETIRGRIRQKADVTDTIRQDVVDSEASWWFPEKTGELPSLFGALESNSNMLTLEDPDLCDPLTGAWCNRGLLCKVYKAE